MDAFRLKSQLAYTTCYERCNQEATDVHVNWEEGTRGWHVWVKEWILFLLLRVIGNFDFLGLGINKGNKKKRKEKGWGTYGYDLLRWYDG